jgi:hypothetical protein
MARGCAATRWGAVVSRKPPSQFERRWKVRTQFTNKFLADLAEAWEQNGKAALTIMFHEEPSKFVQVCAALMPRQVELDASGPLAELTEEELQALMETVRQQKAKLIEHHEQEAVTLDAEP